MEALAWMHRGASGLPVYMELEPHPEHSKDMILKTEGAGPRREY